MAHSDAFRSLSPSAVKLWIELRSRFNGHNNGDVSLSFREAESLLRLGRGTIGRAFAELEAKGFIIKTCEGWFFGRKAATYELCDCRPQDGGPAKRSWQNWKPDEEKSSGSGMGHEAC